MPRAFLRSRAKSFFRRVSKRARVVFECVLHFSPVVCFLNCFFFLSYKFRVFESFQGTLKRIRFQKRHSFGLFLPNTPLQREREREREAAMKIHLKTLCVVLSKRFPGRRSFPSSLSTAPFFGSRLFEMDFFFRILSSCDSFFSNRNPKRPSLTRNACVVSLLLPRVGYKTTERRKSSTST